MQIPRAPKAYRFENMSAAQRCLTLFAFVIIVHGILSLCLWSMFLYVELSLIFRLHKGVPRLQGLLRHVEASSKSTVPMFAAMFGIYCVPYRTRLATLTLSAAFVSLVFFACYDIYFDQWDLMRLGSHPKEFFLNWWWYQPNAER